MSGCTAYAAPGWFSIYSSTPAGPALLRLACIAFLYLHTPSSDSPIPSDLHLTPSSFVSSYRTLLRTTCLLCLCIRTHLRLTHIRHCQTVQLYLGAVRLVCCFSDLHLAMTSRTACYDSHLALSSCAAVQLYLGAVRLACCFSDSHSAMTSCTACRDSHLALSSCVASHGFILVP